MLHLRRCSNANTSSTLQARTGAVNHTEGSTHNIFPITPLPHLPTQLCEQPLLFTISAQLHWRLDGERGARTKPVCPGAPRALVGLRVLLRLSMQVDGPRVGWDIIPPCVCCFTASQRACVVFVACIVNYGYASFYTVCGTYDHDLGVPLLHGRVELVRDVALAPDDGVAVALGFDVPDEEVLAALWVSVTEVLHITHP